MALQRIGEEWAFGSEGISADGIVEVTGYSVRKEFTTQREGKGSDGEIGAFLYGGQKFTISVEGYAEEGSLPEIGGDIEVNGISGKIMSVEKTGNNEDFVRMRVEGVGYPNLQ